MLLVVTYNQGETYTDKPYHPIDSQCAISELQSIFADYCWYVLVRLFFHGSKASSSISEIKHSAASFAPVRAAFFEVSPIACVFPLYRGAPRILGVRLGADESLHNIVSSTQMEPHLIPASLKTPHVAPLPLPLPPPLDQLQC